MLDFLEILEHFCTKILSIHICHKVWKKMLEDATVKLIFSWMQRWDFYENTRRRDDCRAVPYIGNGLFPFLQFSLHFNVSFWNTFLGADRSEVWISVSVMPLCWDLEAWGSLIIPKESVCVFRWGPLLAVLVVPVNIHESQTFEKIHMLLVVTSM